MIWYICFFLTLLLFAAALRVALRRAYGELRVGVVLLFLLAASFVIYLPIFFTEYDPAAAIFGALLNVLRMITLDSGYLDYYETITTQVHSEFFRQCFVIVLGLAHVLLPAISALAAYTILLRCYASFQLFLINLRRRPVYVFSEWNPAAEGLARSIRSACGRKCDVVFANVREKPDQGSDLRRERFVFHADPITELKLRRKAKQTWLFCLGEDRDGNLNDALSLIRTVSECRPEVQKHTHIFIRSELPDCDTVIDSAPKGEMDIRILNESEEIAYALLQAHPLFRSAENGRIRMVLAGFGDVNRALLRAAVWYGQMDGYEMEIHVAGTDIERDRSDFCARYPALAPGGRYRIFFHNCSDSLELEQTLREHCPDATYVVIQAGSDDENIELGLRLRRAYRLWDPAYGRSPEIFVYSRSADKDRIIARLRTSDSKDSRRVSYALVPFGRTESVFSYENLVESPLEGLARNVHLVYSDIFSDGNLDVEDALSQYNLLEVKKRSNRANAMHIRYKLALLGLDYTDDPTAPEAELADYLDKEQLARLTRAEHNRWVAFLESEGWSGADIEQVRAYREAGLAPGRHESAILKLHPFICPFDELPARSEALGQKDSTVYDEQLIVRIPEILHDRWGVAGRKYRLIRRPACGDRS